ncbi:hypothetical protein HF295_04520 [Hujiaoplasma nucleasis]|uniref:Uncharacterized protein n=1 Tax=Hujiaoplasma nucleasis TaxID=2725268 RepID=A0A7L6N6N0_9MOLU|nr:hypothetical protein [Hujiaoplasma nucleasis]QLY40164.1 hypothetical protein HF295_04520 [Hujiaoplasma nucleasis]
MAIIKALYTKFDISVSYHRITAFNISYAHKKITICLASYVSKEARAKQSKPIEELDISIPFEDYPLFLGVNPIVASYKWLKENVIGFEDALDDFDVLEPMLTNLEGDIDG